MKRLGVLLYGVISYLIFFATFLYAMCFVGNFLVTKTIDSGPTASLGIALLVNIALLGVFAIQHSVMARPTFKRWWTKIIPEPTELSTSTLISSLALLLLFWQWQPMGGMIWNVSSSAAQIALYSLFGFGWGLVLISTFLINHFDLFGLRQVWLSFRGIPYTSLKFKTPGPYKLVRHPLYLGWLFAFWATPTMSAAHLLFAIITTAYIFFAILLEERTLIDCGPEYAAYRKRVSMIFPLPKSKPIEPT